MSSIRPLPPPLQKIANEELNEVSERIPDDIQALQEWIRKEPNLTARCSPQFLIAFLRTSKFSLERTKERIKKFYSLRNDIPEIYNNRIPDDPRILEVLRLGVCLRLPQVHDENGALITIIRTGVYDPNKYTFSEIIKVGTIISDIQIIEDDNSVVSGYMEIMDMKNVTANHLFHLEINLIKKLSIMAEEGMPIRHKGIHFINTPLGFETIYNAMIGLMGEKSRSRLHVHGNNLESLYKHIPKRLLPVEYGGHNGTINDILQDWEKKFLSYTEYFVEEQKYGATKKLCNKNSGTTNNSSLNGTFRKLNLD